MTALEQEEALYAAAELLEASENHRVLRRLAPRINMIPPAETKRGCLIDVETTGLDPAVDEIVELALVPFTYTPDGRIYETGPAFSGLRQPKKPIPPEMTAIHGIDDEMVMGAVIDPAEVAGIIAEAAPIIAHHAEFDRPFVEKLFPEFEKRPWACSMSQIDWRAEGFDGQGLAYLGLASGFFYDKHEAEADCWAMLALLERSLPKSGKPALLQLLEKGRLSTWRVFAENSPFQQKDNLKARGYRWNPDRKVWFTDVEGADAELEFLGRKIYRKDASNIVRIKKVTAFDRFSVRAG